MTEPEIEWALTEKHIEVAHEIEEHEYLLAHLLLNSVVFLNTHWNEKTWPEEAQHGYIVLVLCNDSFGPGADCEPIHYKDLPTLYRLWRKDPVYGPLAWCITQRKQRPWRAETMAKRWDIDALVRGELP